MLSERWRNSWSHYRNYLVFKDFDQVAWTSMIRQGLGELKSADSEVALQAIESQPARSVLRVSDGLDTLLASCFVTFKNSAKESKIVDLCLILPKYCNFFPHARIWCNLTKGYWMRNNQTRGCKSNRKLYHIKKIRGVFNMFPDFFVQALKIGIDSCKFSMLLRFILWDDWPIFVISSSKEQL